MTDPKPASPRSTKKRLRWADRWLLDAFRRAKHPLSDVVEGTAPSAWEALERAGVPAAEVLRTACAAAAVDAADLNAVGPAQAAMLDEAVALRYAVVPSKRIGSVLEVATANPLVEGLEQAVGFAAGCRVRALVASPSEVAAAHRRIYAAPAGTARPGATVKRGISWRRVDGKHAADAGGLRGGAAEMLDLVVSEALAQGASDVHLEPQADDMLVRFRIDGVMHDGRHVPHETATNLISRLKVQAGLDISDRMRPQDGRASVTYDGRAVDLRISTLPLGNRSEKVVVRLLDSATSSVALDALGFTVAERERIERLLTLNEGMVLVTGPTGSGKTTTLYSAIQHLQSGRTNIMTVEDPVEYLLEGVNQVQVNERSGMTFAAALRSILRQDPDVVLLGEIRDADTASTAIKASMTGHLLLSTLHTNDAASAVARLLDIGAEPGALAGALKGVVAQRLVRKVCQACSEDADVGALPPEFQALLATREGVRLRRATGCSACRGTGYRGRSVVSEVLVVTPDLQRAIARGANVNELGELARAGGMQSLWESGVDRVVNGVTTYEELIDNVASRAADEARIEHAASPVSGTSVARSHDASIVDRVHAHDVDATIRHIARGAAHPARRSSGRMVLVVDDDLAARRALAVSLEDAGFDVVQCADGSAALAYIRRLRPALVVTEVATPKLDATALLRELVGESEQPTVLVYTEQRQIELVAWLMTLGAHAVVGKDAGPDAVVAAVEALCETVSESVA